MSSETYRQVHRYIDELLAGHFPMVDDDGILRYACRHLGWISSLAREKTAAGETRALAILVSRSKRERNAGFPKVNSGIERGSAISEVDRLEIWRQD